MNRNYWGYRIDTNNIAFFRQELDNNRLRQGWGYDDGQNLRILSVDEGARKNLPILNKVKKGDILLVPRLPDWDEVAIVEALEDFSSAYRFEISEEYHDYGHIFPAKLLKSFRRKNAAVSGKVRATLKNVSRFWNINHCQEDIDKLLQKNNSELRTVEDFEDSFSNAVADCFHFAFKQNEFKEKLYEKMNDKFTNEEWEFALVEGLRKYFPEPCSVERTGGTAEKDHGTDILIKLPGLLGYQYYIAIQVKDYAGLVGNGPIAQISKVDDYSKWNNENAKVIEKILIVTKAPKEINQSLIKNENDVRVIFAEELKDLLSSIGQSYLGLERS